MDIAERRKLIRMITGKTKLKITEWIENEIGTSYASFTYRLANDALELRDYHAIIRATGLSFEQIWPQPGAPKKELPVVKMTPDPAPKKSETPPTTNTEQRSEVPKKPEVTPGKSDQPFVPVIPDVYGGDSEALMQQ